MKIHKNKTLLGFTFAEMMMAAGCGSLVLAALIMTSVLLQRSFTAVEAYSIATGDQLRVQDYIAMDCRRSVGVTWDSVNQKLTLTVPNYYDAITSSPVAPSFDANGAVQYVAGTTNIIYYKSGSSFMRAVGSNAAECLSTAAWSNCAKPIATDVSSFNAIITNGSGAGGSGTVRCAITFSPRFRRSTPNVAGTTVFAETFLRNGKARQ